MAARLAMPPLISAGMYASKPARPTMLELGARDRHAIASAREIRELLERQAHVLDQCHRAEQRARLVHDAELLDDGEVLARRRQPRRRARR